MDRDRRPEEEMMLEITARYFGYEEDDDDEVVEAALSESLDGTGFVLSMQRTTYEPDDQDVSMGMDTYCLVSGGKSHYGGVLRARREGNLIHLVISPAASSLLGLPEEIRASLAGSPLAISEFFSGLPGILQWGRREDRAELIGF
ncbi:Imm10 family immunity protein [Streptomyces sp. NPDC090021]|uniref:Imm10 family immunity protein n=1 Tax=Streptomyces sp. NPDC090021 TaxID=3365919 RepID=UPI003810CD05